MKGKKHKAAPPAETEPGAFYIRNNEAMRELRAGERLRALAKRAGASETHVARALLALGLRQAEADIGALSRAFIAENVMHIELTGMWGCIELQRPANEPDALELLLRSLATDLEWLRVRFAVEGLALSHHAEHYEEPDEPRRRTVRGTWGAVQITLSGPDDEAGAVLARVGASLDALAAFPGVELGAISDNMGSDGKVWKRGPIRHDLTGRA